VKPSIPRVFALVSGAYMQILCATSDLLRQFLVRLSEMKRVERRKQNNDEQLECESRLVKLGQFGLSQRFEWFQQESKKCRRLKGRNNEQNARVSLNWLKRERERERDGMEKKKRAEGKRKKKMMKERRKKKKKTNALIS
jgi:hypothetical protein